MRWRSFATAKAVALQAVAPQAVALLVAALLVVVAAAQQKALDVYVIDVEGGQATLFVAPSGESMLVDAGWSGVDGRDADRIAAVAKRAGLTQLDYLVVTHYHRDHVGGVPDLVKRLPVHTFVDHGPTVETNDASTALFNAYVEARKTGKHLQVKPGDRLPLKGLDVRIVAAGGELISQPIASAAPNPLCASFKPEDPDRGENARSVGMVITHGSFRMLDLGDLTWNKEKDLVCPNNLLGTFDVYLVTHHGSDTSGPPVIVHAVRPRVAVMNNGMNKGGSQKAWRTVRDTPGLEDFWQVHYAAAAGADHNSPQPMLANVDESTAHGLKIAAQTDGSFTVTNERNGQTKRYAAARR